MNKKVLISSVAITAAASAVAITLFVPHTITVKEYMDGNLKGFKPETTEIKTSLFDSLKNPITVSHRNVDHADYTGTTVDGKPIADGLIGKVYKDETVYVDYKPTIYTANFKEDGVSTYAIDFQYGEKPELPSSAFLASNHPYENFKEWKEEDSSETKTVETGTEDLSITYDAVYEGKTYKITYDLDGGNAENPDSYQYGVGVDSLNNASKNGYTFDGWYSDADKTQKVESISKDDHDDKTLYAKFHENPKPVVKPQPAQKATGSANVNAGSTNANNSTASSKASTASQPSQSSNNGFPYVGNMGAIRIGNYTAALYSGGNGQSYADMPNTAWTQDIYGDYLGEDTGAPDFMAFYDHAYQGTKAAISSGQPLQWLKPDGTVVTLTQKRQVVANLKWKGVDGVDYMDGRTIQSLGGTILFQTCYGSGNLLGIY